MGYGFEGKYHTLFERDSVKYEIVDAGTGMFGEQLYQACTFQKEMHPQMVRRVLGTFTKRADAEARLRDALELSSGK